MNENEIIEIMINEDIDQYEAEVWKGLSARHIKAGFLVLVSVIGFYLITNYIFLVPPFLAVLIALILSIPIGVWNFIKVEEMSFKTFINRKWKYAFGSPYMYESSFYNDLTEETLKERKHNEKNKQKQKKKRKGKKKAEGKINNKEGEEKTMNNLTPNIIEAENINNLKQEDPFIRVDIPQPEEDASNETIINNQTQSYAKEFNEEIESINNNYEQQNAAAIEDEADNLDSLDVYFPDLMEEYAGEKETNEQFNSSLDPSHLAALFTGVAKEKETETFNNDGIDYSEMFRKASDNMQKKDVPSAPSIQHHDQHTEEQEILKRNKSSVSVLPIDGSLPDIEDNLPAEQTIQPENKSMKESVVNIQYPEQYSQNQEENVATYVINGDNANEAKENIPNNNSQNNDIYKYEFYEDIIKSLKETIKKQEETIKAKDEVIALQKAHILNIEGGARR